MEPGIEPLRFAQPGQVAPGSHHGLLDSVARELPVPEDESGGRVQPRERTVEERAEGVLVTSGRSFDEASLVHGHPSIRRDRPIALTGYGVADREKVSGSADKRDEGVMIAPLRPFDECSLVHGHRFLAATTSLVALGG